MTPVIALNNVSIGYEKRTLLSGLNFRVEKGESLLIIGHNGSGKTTLLKTIFGLIPSCGGDLEVLGNTVVYDDCRQLVLAGARYLAQETQGFSELSIASHQKVLEELYGFSKNRPISTDFKGANVKKFWQLSLGSRRLELLKMLSCGSPKLYILDEPTAGVDLKNQDYILEWTKKAHKLENVSIILVEHNFRNFLSTCEKTLIINKGQVTYFGPSEPLLDEAVLRSHYL